MVMQRSSALYYEDISTIIKRVSKLFKCKCHTCFQLNTSPLPRLFSLNIMLMTNKRAGMVWLWAGMTEHLILMCLPALCIFCVLFLFAYHFVTETYYFSVSLLSLRVSYRARVQQKAPGKILWKANLIPSSIDCDVRQHMWVGLA